MIYSYYTYVSCMRSTTTRREETKHLISLDQDLELNPTQSITDGFRPSDIKFICHLVLLECYLLIILIPANKCSRGTS